MPKVVYNTVHGGFNLSEKALEKMFELGSPYVKENSDYNAKNDYGDTIKWWTKKYTLDYNIPRHDETLVKVVTEMGDSASGEFSNLETYDVLNSYIIEEYDGKEYVVQPQDIQWIKTSNRL